jgi:hypothetical protein
MEGTEKTKPDFPPSGFTWMNEARSTAAQGLHS